MRFAIIGCTGHVGYALETMKKRSDFELAAVAQGNPEESFEGFAASMRSMKGEPRIYADWRELLDRERIDVAVVGAWCSRNAEISVECLKRGVHVYSEKPLAVTLESLELLTRTWERSGCSLDGMFGLRYCSWFLTVRRAIEAGEIGRVRQIHGQKSYRMGRRGPMYFEQKLYGGILPWVAIHAMDWAVQLGGECQWVQGVHCQQENRGHGEMETTSAAMMRLQNGVIATVAADFLRPDGSGRHDDDRLRVTGTEGMIEAVDGRVFLENARPKRELSLTDAPAPMDGFLNAVGTPRAKELGLAALSVTRTALMARDSANLLMR